MPVVGVALGGVLKSLIGLRIPSVGAPIAESRLFPCIHYHQCRVSVCEVDVKDGRLIFVLEWAIDDLIAYIISIVLAIGVALRLC